MIIRLKDLPDHHRKKKILRMKLVIRMLENEDRKAKNVVY